MRRSQNQGVLLEKTLNPVTNTETRQTDFGSVNNESKVENVSQPLNSSGHNRTVLSKAFSCSNTSSICSEQTSLFLDPKQFHDQFSKNVTPIVDCRSQIDFSIEHIRSAHNINCRSKLIARKLISKKLEDIEPSLISCLKCSESIILYDQCSDHSTEDQIRTLPIYLVVQAARRSNKKVYIIKGGFQAIKFEYPQFIRINSQNFLTEDESTSIVVTPEPIDKENFVMTEILPQIFVGNAHDSQNIERLQKFGISHVINATPDLPICLKPENQTLRISIYDLPSENIQHHFETAIEFIEKAIFCKSNNVLVHCSAGISRSPTLVLAFMIKKENLTLEEALTKMRNLRSIIDPNFSFISQLRSWEKKCRMKIDSIDNNAIHSVVPRSRSSSQYCGSSSATKTDGQTAIVVN